VHELRDFSGAARAVCDEIGRMPPSLRRAVGCALTLSDSPLSPMGDTFLWFNGDNLDELRVRHWLRTRLRMKAAAS
jgi:hypothetical protein